MQVDFFKKGLTIPDKILQDAKISGNIDIKIRDKEITIKEKNITRSIKGYCGKLRLSPKEMKEIYLDSILEKYDK